MNGFGRPASLSSGLLIGIVIVLVTAGVGGYFLLRNTSDTGETNLNTTNANVDIQPTDISVSWPTFISPYRVSVPLPRGMTPCDLTNGTFSFRNDACTSTGAAPLEFRRSDGWDGQDPVTVFDDAFAQELREAGLESIAGLTAPVSGRYANGVMYTFNDALTGAVVTEADPPVDAKARHLVIIVNRQSAPTADGIAQNADDTLLAVIQGAKFSLAQTSTNTNASSN